MRRTGARPQRFAALTLGLGGLLLVAGAARGQPRPLAPEARIEQRLDAAVPLDTPLRDEEGRVRRLGEVTSGRPTILVLAWYRCPRLCNVVLAELLRGLQEVEYTAGQEFEVVAISIDPSEGPDLARAKKEAHATEYDRAGAEAGWHFLTGEE